MKYKFFLFNEGCYWLRLKEFFLKLCIYLFDSLLRFGIKECNLK